MICEVARLMEEDGWLGGHACLVVNYVKYLKVSFFNIIIISRVRRRTDQTEYEAKILRSGQAVVDADPVPLTSTAFTLRSRDLPFQ